MEKQIHGFVGQTATCLKCGKVFEPIRKKQRFCCPACRVAYNNDRKASGIHLAPRVFSQLQDIADGQGVPIDAMANVMLARVLNPDGKPLEDSEIYGTKT
jgi:predicted  nucleic acid-binding Zn-ribbon protein